MTREYDGEIDESMPGSDTDGHDGVASQLTEGDTLNPTGLADQLDEGYDPPDREPRTKVPTAAEEEEGASLDELLSAETPEVWDRQETDNLFDESGTEVGDARSGRLVDEDSDGWNDVEKDLVAGDVGIDGAGASAEEAAVHVIADEPYED